MTLTCFIRYQIDPFQREAFAQYARALGGGSSRAAAATCVGYFLPHEGTNDVAWGAHRVRQPRRVREPTARASRPTRRAARTSPSRRSSGFILREERTFLEAVGGTNRAAERA